MKNRKKSPTLINLIHEQTIKVVDLDYEPTLQAIKKIANDLGIDMNDIMNADVEMRSDYDFTVQNIPNHAIKSFSVGKSDDETSFDVSAPDTAKRSISIDEESDKLKKLAGL